MSDHACHQGHRADARALYASHRSFRRLAAEPRRDRGGGCSRGALQPLQPAVQPGAAAARGIAYVFLGSELGGRSTDPACYDDGRISYERLGATSAFRKGLDRVAQGSASRRIVLMCAEKEPLECHRCLLVAPALEARGIPVAHIRPESALEPHADAMSRLLAMHGMQDAVERQRLFPRSRAERITEAIARQADRFGHRNDRSNDHPAPASRPGRGVQT